MKKTKQEIWKQLKTETNKQYHFFKKYREIHYQISIKKFHEKIMKNYGKNTEHSYKLPSFWTIESYSVDNNWISRKDAYLRHLAAEMEDKLFLEHKLGIMEEYRLNNQVNLKSLRDVNSVLDDPFYKGNKAYYVVNMMTASSIARDGKRLIVNEPTEHVKSDNTNIDKSICKDEEFKELFDKRLKEVI